MLRDSLTVRSRIQGKGSVPETSMGRSGDWGLKLREEDVGEKASLGKRQMAGAAAPGWQDREAPVGEVWFGQQEGCKESMAEITEVLRGTPMIT